jgi:hypothetical protein
MTSSELIALLQEMDPELLVGVPAHSDAENLKDKR